MLSNDDIEYLAVFHLTSFFLHLASAFHGSNAAFQIFEQIGHLFFLRIFDGSKMCSPRKITCFFFINVLYLDWLINVIFIFEKQGVQACTFYLQNGHCKFGSTCKFDHPLGTMRYSPSASSLVDMPVAPYPVGSLLATLAPSSTSSELRPELISGSKKDSYLSRIPSSGSTSSSSMGLIFSQTGSVPLSDLQISGQTSVPLSSSRNTRQGGDIRHSSW